MMKKTMIMMALMLMAYSASAQFTLGPRVTLTSSVLSLKETVANVNDGTAEFGYQYGVFARFRIPIIGLYAQPELLLSNVNNNLTINNTKVNLSFNRIDVPVMLGVKLGLLRVNAGPSFSFLTKAKSDVKGTITDVKNNYKSTTVGFQAGVGLDLLKFVIDLKYESSLSGLSKSMNLAGVALNTDQRVSQAVLAVGFKLF